jgi:hypothetical protein
VVKWLRRSVEKPVVWDRILMGAFFSVFRLAITFSKLSIELVLAVELARLSSHRAAKDMAWPSFVKRRARRSAPFFRHIESFEGKTVL